VDGAGITENAMEIVSYDKCSELGALQDAWDRLCEKELQFVPSFSELLHHLNASGAKFRVLAAKEESQIIALACFTYGIATKRYEIATRKLFDLPVQLKEISLFGSCVPGQPSEDVIRKFFQTVIDESQYDFITVGEIFIDSPLYRAIKSLPGGVVAWSASRKKQYRWMIRLPGSFDEYIASLRPTAKAHITRDSRRFERERPGFRVLQRPEDVEQFLQEAEKISRLTYQWKFGYGLHNDERTRQRLTRLAEIGTLRCYIADLQGNPCAFGWGELCHRTFAFRMTGYDPHYAKLSPGTGLIMRMIRDLIENTNCEIFDFMAGGETGYKSRLGNINLSCASMQVAQIYRPYSLLLVVLDQTINLAKNAAMGLGDAALGSGPLKQRLKSALRLFGVGTY
jgi:Acetyltransferase (GNAT) domain